MDQEETGTQRPGTAMQKWADAAMFRSEPLDATTGPRVHLLHMSNDPLGQIAAMALMYKGIVVRDLADVTDQQRREMFEQIKKTRLKAPFEAVSLHWMVEGVTRSLTHQMVRQRTAVFAQESLRFAVVEDGFDDRVALPPSLAGTEQRWIDHAESVDNSAEHGGGWSEDQRREQFERSMGSETEEERWRAKWDYALREVQQVYTELVNDGMPAEDARGLLPHNVTTRLNYKTDLRNFAEHAGNRLCTQAQFEWRALWIAFVQELRRYGSERSYRVKTADFDEVPRATIRNSEWQFNLIAELFRPACYLTGKCEFAAQDLDRKCSIRNRVDANHQLGRSSEEWGQEHDAVDPTEIVTGVGPTSVVRDQTGQPVFIGAIHPREWLADPGAAR